MKIDSFEAKKWLFFLEPIGGGTEKSVPNF